MSDFLTHLREPEVPDWLKLLYGLVFLATFTHATLTENALTCCPPAYVNIETFVHCVQSAVGWTLVVIAIVEVTTIMVFMVPKVYYGIKGKGEREGIVKGREEGRAEGVDDTLAAARDAMRDAGVDDETRRRVEDDIAWRARRARRNGL